MRFFSACLVGCCLVAGCQASELYTFSYAAATGPIQSFSFSFTSPTFVADGESPAFIPFSVTDGAKSWAMTRDWVMMNPPDGCFLFGTPKTDTIATAPCGMALGGDNSGGLLLDFYGGLPSQSGIFPANPFFGVFTEPSGVHLMGPTAFGLASAGYVTLTITDVVAPEPSSLALMAIGFVAFAGILAKKTRLRSGTLSIARDCA